MLPSERSSKTVSDTNVVKISSICSVSASVPSVPLILKVIKLPIFGIYATKG